MNMEEFYNIADFAIYAHYQEKENKKETLKEHTDLCCDYFKKIFPQKKYDVFWSNIKRFCGLEEISVEAENLIKEMWYAVPFFHDMGKINPNFQKNKMENLIANSDELKSFSILSSRHSMFSSVLYINTFARKIKEIIQKKEERWYCVYIMFCNAYVISSHHSTSLGDFKNFLNKFYENCSENEAFKIVNILHNEYMKKVYREEIFLKTSGQRVVGEEFFLLKMLEIFQKKFISKETALAFYTYVRLLYSVLIASDYYSTTEFFDNMKTDIISGEAEIEKMRELYEKSELMGEIRSYERDQYGKIQDFCTVKKMNVMRNELFLDAECSLLNHTDHNIYYLEAPTGSGKSNVAFQLSFLLQKLNHMEKIFYVYPFNTLVEQNYDIMKKMFGNREDIMDHIAVINSITPILVEGKESEKEKEKRKTLPEEESNKELYKKALLNRQFLNYPIVLTTSVSLFQFLFSEKQDNLMGFHKFQNSVIILDEIQSYKNTIWTEIITFFDAFAEILNMKVIIMSATLPDLNHLIIGKSKPITLISNREKYYKNPIFSERVVIHYDLMKEKITLELLFQHLKQYQDSKKKILIEFITKKSAMKFYAMMKEKKGNGELLWADIELMTGNDNQVERKRLIRLTKEERKDTALILIATQVVEAGVDIDMDVGYKDSSLLDSEEQFLGRINRSYKGNGVFGEVWFFDLDSEKTVYKNDLRVPADFTIRSENMRNVLETKEFSEYYFLLLESLKEQNREINENNIVDFFENTVGKMEFAEIAKRMRLIEDNNRNVSIYFCRDVTLEDGEVLSGKKVWDEYKALLKNQSMDYAEKKVLLSQIQSKMDYFIYEVKRYKIGNSNFIWNDQIGELYCIEDSDDYFVDGKFNEDMFECNGGLII